MSLLFPCVCGNSGSHDTTETHKTAQIASAKVSFWQQRVVTRLLWLLLFICPLPLLFDMFVLSSRCSHHHSFPHHSHHHHLLHHLHLKSQSQSRYSITPDTAYLCVCTQAFLPYVFISTAQCQVGSPALIFTRG